MSNRLLALAALPLLLILSACGSSTSSGDAGAGSASAAPAAADLAGTSWTLTSYADASGAEVSATAAPQSGSLTFSADGAVAGSTGCNSFTGTYEQDGTALTIVPGPMTLRACAGPVAEQEAALLAALPNVASFTADSTLVLLDASGAQLLAYAAAPAGLSGTSWTATGINNGKEAVVSDATTGGVTAMFGADGTLTGSGGCNTYTATYTTSGSDAITIGPVASTRMMCEDAVMATEQAYFTGLAAVTTYEQDANSLTLRDASGAAQAVFAPAQ